MCIAGELCTKSRLLQSLDLSLTETLVSIYIFQIHFGSLKRVKAAITTLNTSNLEKIKE